MKVSDIKEKSREELAMILGKKEEELRKSRFDMVSKQSKNTRLIRNLRKDIALILTLINQKQQ
jgi:ribosomal protein L29